MLRVKDIRLPEIYEILHDQASRLNPLNRDEGIEVHLQVLSNGQTLQQCSLVRCVLLQVTKELSGPPDGRGVLTLAINYSYCVASYDLEEVKEWETLIKDPRLCRSAPAV